MGTDTRFCLTFKGNGRLPSEESSRRISGEMDISQEQNATILKKLFPEFGRLALFSLGGRPPALEVPRPVHRGNPLEKAPVPAPFLSLRKMPATVTTAERFSRSATLNRIPPLPAHIPTAHAFSDFSRKKN